MYQGSVARRLSIHRATTVGPKSPLCQVIVKNTTAIKDPSTATSESSINRSQSLLTTNSRIPILAPPRCERARLEAQLSDVWSRKILPFPGITNRSRSEQLVRTSASTMMRKLSVASITNSFTKRSGSSASVNTMKTSDEEAPHANRFVDLSATLHRDLSSPALEFDEDYLEIQRLPMIRDTTERTNSCSPRIQPTGASTPSGTARRQDVSKLGPRRGEPTDMSEKPPLNAPVLQMSSVNSVSQLSLDRAASPALPLTEKENISQAQKVKRPVQETSSPTKPSKRSKVGVKNRNLVTGAIRSFFPLRGITQRQNS